GADPVRVRGRPPGPQGARLAGPDGAPEGRLDVLVVRGQTVSGTDPRLVGGPERLCGRPPLEVDLGDDGLRRARGRVLSRPGAAPPGKAVRAVVPLPLAGPLLLRPSGRPRRPDRPRLWGRPPARLRARAPSEEAAVRRALEPRRGPPRHRRRPGALVCRPSERPTHPTRSRSRRETEQDDHAHCARGTRPGRPSDVVRGPPTVTADPWTVVDTYFEEKLLPSDPVLEEALRASKAAGLPSIQVSPSQGKLLYLLAKAQGVRTILEVGTLGGYSTIWLGRALPKGGRLLTLEVDPQHAEVARANVARAGLESKVEVLLGPALETLPQLLSEHRGPFDFVFLDADKPNTRAYFDWAVRL